MLCEEENDDNDDDDKVEKRGRGNENREEGSGEWMNEKERDTDGQWNSQARISKVVIYIRIHPYTFGFVHHITNQSVNKNKLGAFSISLSAVQGICLYRIELMYKS